MMRQVVVVGTVHTLPIVWSIAVGIRGGAKLHGVWAADRLDWDMIRFKGRDFVRHEG